MVKEVSCSRAGYDCPFEIRSENDDELISMTQQHAQETHGQDLAADEVRSIWREV